MKTNTAFKIDEEFTPVERVIFERRSTRAFKKEPVPDHLIRRILEAGRFAPSAGNSQPWRFAVVNNPEILKEMEKDAVKVVKLIMWALDYSRSTFRKLFLRPLSRLFIRMIPNELHPVPFGLMRQIAAGNAPVFHGAPTVILLIEDKRGIASPPTDIGICGENMVLSAHSMGIGTCWIGLIKVLMYLPKWKKFFGIKFPYKLDVSIALGWPKITSDGMVPREVQLVEWYEGDMTESPRIEKQGD